MRTAKRDVYSLIEQAFHCTITQIGEIKKTGRGSYEHIPGLGDSTIFDCSLNKEYALFDSQGHLLAEATEDLSGIARALCGLDIHTGGMIVFSANATAVALPRSRLMRFFMSKYSGIVHRLQEHKKLAKMIGDKLSHVGAFSVGRFFTGRYGEPVEYNESSACIEIRGVPSEVVLALATEIAREFSQETVLLRDYSTGRNMLIHKREA